MTELFRSLQDHIFSGATVTPDPDPDPPTVGQMTGGDGSTGGTLIGNRVTAPPVRTGNGTWDNEQAKVTGANGRITISSLYGSVHPSYTTSYQFVNLGSSDIGNIGGPNNQRTELYHALKTDGSRIQPVFGETRYYGVALLLPTGTLAGMTDNLTFFQAHPPGSGTQPTRVRVDFATGRISARYTRPDTYTSGSAQVGTRPVVENGWMKVVLKIKWGTAGTVEVWTARPGETAFTKEISLAGNNMAQGDNFYWKCGQYWANSSQTSAKTTYMNNVIFGTSFDVVAARAFGVTMV